MKDSQRRQKLKIIQKEQSIGTTMYSKDFFGIHEFRS